MAGSLALQNSEFPIYRRAMPRELPPRHNPGQQQRTDLRSRGLLPIYTRILSISTTRIRRSVCIREEPSPAPLNGNNTPFTGAGLSKVPVNKAAIFMYSLPRRSFPFATVPNYVALSFTELLHRSFPLCPMCRLRAAEETGRRAAPAVHAEYCSYCLFACHINKPWETEARPKILEEFL